MAWILNWTLGPHRFESNSPWGVLTGVCALFAGVILSLVAVIGALFAVTLVLPDQMAGMQRCTAIVGTTPSLECSAWLVGMTGAFALVLSMAFVGIAYARQESTPGNSLLLRAAHLRWWQYLALVALMLAVVFGTGAVLTLASGATQQDLELGIDYLKVIIADGRWQNWLLVIAVVVVAGPFVEETVFRGFMFSVLIKTPAGFIGAAVITSASWTLLHVAYSWPSLIVLFVFGCCLAYVVWRTGSLWPAVVAHGAINLSSAIVLALR